MCEIIKGSEQYNQNNYENLSSEDEFENYKKIFIEIDNFFQNKDYVNAKTKVSILKIRLKKNLKNKNKCINNNIDPEKEKNEIISKYLSHEIKSLDATIYKKNEYLQNKQNKLKDIKKKLDEIEKENDIKKDKLKNLEITNNDLLKKEKKYENLLKGYAVTINALENNIKDFKNKIRLLEVINEKEKKGIVLDEKLKNLDKEFQLKQKSIELNRSVIEKINAEEKELISKIEKTKEKKISLIEEKKQIEDEIEKELYVYKEKARERINELQNDRLLYNNFKELFKSLKVDILETKIAKFIHYTELNIQSIKSYEKLKEIIGFKIDWKNQFDFWLKTKTQELKKNEAAEKIIRNIAEKLNYSIIIPRKNDSYNPSLHIPVEEIKDSSVDNGQIVTFTQYGYKDNNKNKTIQKSKVVLAK